jgi:hypothetical protein
VNREATNCCTSWATEFAAHRTFVFVAACDALPHGDISALIQRNFVEACNVTYFYGIDKNICHSLVCINHFSSSCVVNGTFSTIQRYTA